MFTTYINTTNSTTGGVPLDPTGNDVELKKLIIGTPVANANIWIYTENNVGNVTNTTGLAMKLTLPASFATGQLPFVINLSDDAGHGFTLGQGGSVAIDQTIQLTVGWDYSAQPSNQS